MEYNDLIQMNAERELTKEENYKNVTKSTFKFPF